MVIEIYKWIFFRMMVYSSENMHYSYLAIGAPSFHRAITWRNLYSHDEMLYLNQEILYQELCPAHNRSTF